MLLYFHLTSAYSIFMLSFVSIFFVTPLQNIANAYALSNIIIFVLHSTLLYIYVFNDTHTAPYSLNK